MIENTKIMAIAPGQKIGRWTVMDDYKKTAKGEKKWLCRCECGTKRYVLERSLKHGGSLSCGCLRKEAAQEAVSHNLQGQNFGELTVLSRSASSHKNGGVWWLCRCNCGNTVELPGTLLVTGRRTSCGCKTEKHYYSSDITGKVFGRLTAMYPTKERDTRGSVMWHCKCDCGNELDVAYNISPRITENTDVYISLFGELKITTKKGVLTETELKSPKIARLLVYLLLSRKIACSPREIADNLWPDEDIENTVKNLKSLIYRSQKAFQLISDYRLIVSTANGYQLNPELNIITDCQLFDKKWEIAAKAVDLDEKIDFLKKAADLYRGTLFRTARHEHWLMATAVSFEMRYMGIVGELMKCLNLIHDYVGIQQYAAKALHICPHNVDAYFWIIVAMHKLSHSELAKGELCMARCNLLPEEFEELVKRLEEQVRTVLHP